MTISSIIHGRIREKIPLNPSQLFQKYHFDFFFDISIMNEELTENLIAKELLKKVDHYTVRFGSSCTRSYWKSGEFGSGAQPGRTDCSSAQHVAKRSVRCKICHSYSHFGSSSLGKCRCPEGFEAVIEKRLAPFRSSDSTCRGYCPIAFAFHDSYSMQENFRDGHSVQVQAVIRRVASFFTAYLLTAFARNGVM